MRHRCLRILAALFCLLAGPAIAQSPTPFQYSGGPVTTFAATPTDWIVLTGSAKKITITEINVCGTVGAGVTPATVPISIIKRSTANTGGTFAPVTAGNLVDSALNPTAAVVVYTANPTLGTTQAIVNTKALNAGPPGGAGCVFFQYGPGGNAGPFIVLSSGHQVAVNLQNQTLPIGFSATWTIATTEQ